MPEADFTQDLIGTRLRLNVSPDLQLTSFVQYDNGSDSFGTNTRLRWTFDPLGDLFVVYNHNMRTRDPLTLRRELAFASNQLLVKAQYAVRYWRRPAEGLTIGVRVALQPLAGPDFCYRICIRTSATRAYPCFKWLASSAYARRCVVAEPRPQ